MQDLLVAVPKHNWGEMYKSPSKVARARAYVSCSVRKNWTFIEMLLDNHRRQWKCIYVTQARMFMDEVMHQVLFMLHLVMFANLFPHFLTYQLLFPQKLLRQAAKWNTPLPWLNYRTYCTKNVSLGDQIRTFCPRKGWIHNVCTAGGLALSYMFNYYTFVWLNN